MYSLKEVVQYAVKDLTEQMSKVDRLGEEQYDLMFEKQLRELSSVDFTEAMNDNEIQVLNYWLLILKQTLEPLILTLKEASHRLMLECIDASLYETYKQAMLPSIKVMEHLIYMPLISYPVKVKS